MSLDAVELFKPIPGYEGLYEVSDMGRVRAADKYVQCVVRGRQQTRSVPGRVMAQYYTTSGYLSVKLVKDGVRRAHRVNRLVLQAFLGGGDGLDSNHMNGVHTDNRLCNLEWATRQQNVLHYWSVLGGPKAVMPQMKLTDAQVVEILRLRGAGEKILALADKFDVSTSQIQRIVTGQQRQRPLHRRGLRNDA